MGSMTDNVLSLRPWDASLRRAKNKTADLLTRSDIATVVGSMSPLEAYTAVKTLGPSDAGPVLANLTGEQVQALWDLEGWQDHRLSVPDLILWLSSFRESSLETMQRAARSLDFEVLSVLIRKRLLVALKPRDDRSDEDPIPPWLANPSPDIEPLVETPDGRFIIAARPADEDEFSSDLEVDEEDRKWILAFVNDLYQQEEWESVAAALRSAAYDLSSHLEEDAYRFRSGRLEDLGFPPRERAIEIYGLLDPGTSPPLTEAPVVDLSLPVTYAAPLQQGLLNEALQSIEDPAEMRRLEGDLVAVANKALVADGVTPGQAEAMQEVLQRLRGYVELALVEGVEPSMRRKTAAERLREGHLERLFRIGYTLTVRAASRARRVLEHPALGDGHRDLALRRLSTAEQGVLEALLLRRPRLSGAIEPMVEQVFALDRGERSSVEVVLDGGASEVRRPFLSWADLDAVRRVLEDLEQFLVVWGEHPPERPTLGDDVNLPPEERTLDVELATAGAASMLGRSYAVTPLTATDLADLADRVGLGDEGPPRFAVDAVGLAVQAGGGKRVHHRMVRALGAVAEQLWPHVGQERIDPRFVDAVLTRIDESFPG